jgi:hypothetical protein
MLAQASIHYAASASGTVDAGLRQQDVVPGVRAL